ncbi:multicopper oxidase family protein [Kitasatospora sp. NPDC093558]|uniref:multicopper oxidase family protein n=1 Tax=Kitasatospora sp. NPDC093558 TaxID=3155201 RepID=UPI00341FDCE0
MPHATGAAAASQRQQIRRTRRLIHYLTAGAVLLSAAVLGTQAIAAAPPDVPAKPPTTAEQEKGMRAGEPFRDPATADATGGDQNLTVTLEAGLSRFDVSGRQVSGQAYSGGTVVAPTLRVSPGSTVTVKLVNRLPVATNLHFHGMHVSPTDDSDNSFSCVSPGAAITYRLAIPADHPQGTFWYHSHAMGTVCSADGGHNMADMAFTPGQTQNQIFAGLSGAMIVGDNRTLLPAGLRGATAHTFVLKDAQIDAAGRIVQNTISPSNPTVRLVNGQLRPTLALRPNETQLWRLVNAGADITYQLRLDGQRFTVVGEDGIPVAKVSSRDTLLLPPGKRFDVLVTAGASPGQTVLRTTTFTNGPQGDTYPDTELVTVKVDGRAVTRQPDVSGAVPTAPADLAAADVAGRRTVDLSEAQEGDSFYFLINGRKFAADTPAFDTPARLGTVEEWTIVNHTEENHPFHLHTNAFQVVSVNGVAQPYTHREDTATVPASSGGVPGKIVIRIPFADYPGKWMFHCHIAAHEDLGMMSYLNVAR